MNKDFKNLIKEIKSCQTCKEYLPHGIRPVFSVHPSARIIIIGQAPGRKVHESGVPWNDPSGNKLREWMDIDSDIFYDESKIAIVPMGFCYPGKGKSGDLPPREECAPLWHEKILKKLPKIQLILLIGQYSQRYYLDNRKETLTKTVKAYKEYSPKYLPLPHPSPRNFIWMNKNRWFTKEVVPYLQKKVKSILK